MDGKTCHTDTIIFWPGQRDCGNGLLDRHRKSSEQPGRARCDARRASKIVFAGLRDWRLLIRHEQKIHCPRRINIGEPLIKSSMSRVADKIAMIARSATKVVAETTMPRSATQRARDFVATRMGSGFPGGLRRCAAAATRYCAAADCGGSRRQP